MDDLIRKKSVYIRRLFFAVFALTFSVLLMLPFDDTLAAPVTIKQAKNSFNTSDDNMIQVARLDSFSNKIVTIEYSGPDRALGCDCENKLFVYAEKVVTNGNGENKTELYRSEWFDWNESKKFMIYLPAEDKNKSSYNSYYQIFLIRDADLKHNKGFYNANYAYDPSGTHRDGVYLNAYYSVVENVGLDNPILKVGDSVKAEFRCKDYVGILEWNSSNGAVVSTSNDGTLTANNSGEAEISLSIGENTIFKQVVTVASVGKPSDLKLFENEKRKIEFDGVSGTVVWKSSDENVAVVTDGNVLAKNAGSAIITGTCNNLKVEFTVNVVGPELSLSEIELYAGESYTLSVTGPNQNIKWSSDDEKIATVSSGEIKAKYPGKVNIIAQVDNKILVCKLNVRENQLNQTRIELESGEKNYLYPQVFVQGIWFSDNERIVKCSDRGEITALNPGKAKVSLQIESELLECDVVVKKKYAPTGFRSNKSSSVIQLYWDKVDYSSGYVVYLYNNDTGAYDVVSRTGDTAYIAEGFTPDKTYVFRVAAVLDVDGEKIEQELSEKIKVKTDKKDKAGWKTEDGKKYYYKNGLLVFDDKLDIDGDTYIFDMNGCAIVDSFSEFDGILYRTDKEGAVLKNTEVTDKKKGITYIADGTGQLFLKIAIPFDLYSGMEFDIKYVLGSDVSSITGIKLKSEDNNIAYITNDILYTVKPGKVLIKGKADSITVNTKNGYQTYSKMPVGLALEVLKSSLVNDEMEVPLGQTFYILVNGSSGERTYESSDTKVVSVTKKQLKAVGPGKATVKVIIGKEILKCKVMVSKLDAPAGIRSSSETNSIKLEWNSYPDAKSFSVYSYNSKTKKYTLLGKTKKTSYTVKKLKPDTTYSYAIAANVKVNGVVSEQKKSEIIECKTIEDINGWVTLNGKKYYYKKGHPLGTGLKKIKGKLYLFAEDCSLMTNSFNYYNGTMYYSESDGVVAQNKEVKDKKSGVIYIADKTGALTVKPTAREELNKFAAILYSGDSSYSSVCAVIIQNNGTHKLKVGGSSKESMALVYPYANAEPTVAYLYSEDSYSKINSKSIAAGKTDTCYFVMDEKRYFSSSEACICFVFYYDGVKYLGIVDENGGFVFDVYDG